MKRVTHPFRMTLALILALAGTAGCAKREEGTRTLQFWTIGREGEAVAKLLPAFERNIVLVRRKNRSLSPVAHTVWELIHRVVRERNKGFAMTAAREVAAQTTSTE